MIKQEHVTWNWWNDEHEHDQRDEHDQHDQPEKALDAGGEGGGAQEAEGTSRASALQFFLYFGLLLSSVVGAQWSFNRSRNSWEAVM